MTKTYKPTSITGKYKSIINTLPPTKGELSVIMGQPGTGKSLWMAYQKHKHMETFHKYLVDTFTDKVFEIIGDEKIQEFINENC